MQIAYLQLNEIWKNLPGVTSTCVKKQNVTSIPEDSLCPSVVPIELFYCV